MLRDKKLSLPPIWVQPTLVLSKSSPWLGAVALFLALGLGWMMRFHGSFVDEGDILTVARLLQEGNVLYRTIFSHHFPFPYYWMAATFSLLGASLESARLSVLLFQLVAFALTMYASRLYLTIGLIALAWNSVALFSFGNMAIYQSFSAIALVPIFVLTFATLQQQQHPIDRRAQLIFALFATIGLLTNPLTLFPIALSLLFLLFAKRYGAVVVILAAMSFGGVLYLLHLILTNSLVDFYNNAILFNTQVYARYDGAGHGNYIGAILRTTTHALYIYNPAKPMLFPDSLTPYDVVSQWLLSGTVAKLVLILFSLLPRHFERDCATPLPFS